MEYLICGVYQVVSRRLVINVQQNWISITGEATKVGAQRAGEVVMMSSSDAGDYGFRDVR
tara:strand:+ start:513 stop:692 length:180 start_codon:yes stop_codon:yes gene_type:complete